MHVYLPGMQQCPFDECPYAHGDPKYMLQHLQRRHMLAHCSVKNKKSDAIAWKSEPRNNLIVVPETAGAANRNRDDERLQAQLFINGEEVPLSKTMVILGHTFTDDGAITTHLRKRLAAGYAAAATVRKFLARGVLAKEQKIALADAYVSSTLLAGCEAWDLTDTESKRLDSVQQHVLRWAVGMHAHAVFEAGKMFVTYPPSEMVLGAAYPEETAKGVNTTWSARYRARRARFTANAAKKPLSFPEQAATHCLPREGRAHTTRRRATKISA